MKRKIIGYNLSIEPDLINMDRVGDDPQIIETPAIKKLQAFIEGEEEAIERIKAYFRTEEP